MKETKIMDEDGIPLAAEIIRKGGLVAFPTETVYGLGANALDPEAAKKIYAAKGRPMDNPLIVHVASEDAAAPLVSAFPEDARKLMQAFWPGPLTIVLPKAPCVPPETSGGLETLALRCPEHKFALDFLAACKVPVAAPSANLSGRPSPTDAKHVLQDLDGKIDLILDGGAVGIGIESSIIDLSEGCPVLLRPGAVTVQALEEVLGKKVTLDPHLLGADFPEGSKPKAPGMKYRHYAPKAKMLIVSPKRTGTADATGAAPGSGAMPQGQNNQQYWDSLVADRINEETQISVKAGNRVGILCCEETLPLYRTGYGNVKVDIKSLGSREDPLSMTKNLFRLLREFDDDKVEEIFSESYSEDGIGFALMNRLRKAAGMQEIFVEEPY